MDEKGIYNIQFKLFVKYALLLTFVFLHFKFTPLHFCVFGRFLSKISQNFTDSTVMSVKLSEAIKNDPRMKLECNSLFTHTPLC